MKAYAIQTETEKKRFVVGGVISRVITEGDVGWDGVRKAKSDVTMTKTYGQAAHKHVRVC